MTSFAVTSTFLFYQVSVPQHASAPDLGAQNMRQQRGSYSARLSHHTGRSAEPLSTPSSATLDTRINSRSLPPIALLITNNCRPQLLHLSTCSLLELPSHYRLARNVRPQAREVAAMDTSTLEFMLAQTFGLGRSPMTITGRAGMLNILQDGYGKSPD